MSTVTVAEIKTALNKTLTVDDAEIQSMINQAEAEYAEYVGPLAGTVTDEQHTVYGDTLFLDAWGVTSVTSVTGYSGTTATSYTQAVTPADGGTGKYLVKGSRLKLTSGRFCGEVWVTYEAELPENHRATIIADVAGYFEATQDGPVGPADDGYTGAFRGTPTVLFPRIRALAPPRVG